MSKRVPKYRHHKATGQAVVSLNGKDHYLGKYGSPDSHKKYAALISDWQADQTAAPKDLKVSQLTVLYWEHAQGYYVKNGKPSGHQHIVKNALKYLNAECRDVLAVELGPKRLIRFRDSLIERGFSRKYVNDLVSVVKRMYRWGLENELVPGSPNIQAMLTRGVGWAKKGRTKAKERPAVKPVSETDVNAILPHVSRQVRDMIRLQLLCGCRPAEICIMRPRDIEADGDVWLYRPESHKSEHHGAERVIFIGPRGQEILSPWLERNPEAYCFSPAEAEQERRVALHKARKTPLTYGNAPGTNRKDKPRSRPRDCYDKDSYRRAVERGCRKAGIPNWTPNRLRHSRATIIRKTYGIEAAQIALGHSNADVTQIYAERDIERGIQVALEIG